MANKYDPHQLNVRSDKSGKFIIPAKKRIHWFRQDYPVPEAQLAPAIITELIQTTPYHVVKASVVIDEQIVATAHGTAPAYGEAPPTILKDRNTGEITEKESSWKFRELEKAETGAIARALAHAGYSETVIELWTQERTQNTVQPLDRPASHRDISYQEKTNRQNKVFEAVSDLFENKGAFMTYCDQHDISWSLNSEAIIQYITEDFG